MTRRRMAMAAGLAAILSLSIVPGAFAVGDDQDPEVAYCDSLTEYAASVESLRAIGASSTIEEFDAAVDRVNEASSAVQDSVRSLVEAQIADLATAVDGLRSYRDSLSGDATIEQAVQGAGDAITAVATARDEIGTLPNCAVVAGTQAAQEETGG